MLVSEIKAVGFLAHLDKKFAGRGARVIVGLPVGDKINWIGSVKSDDKSGAAVYDYDRDRVGDQCQQVLLQFGREPEVVEV